MTSPDPVWAQGKPRVVVLGPTEEKLTEQLMVHLQGLFSPRYGICDGWAPGPGSTDDEVNARISTADAAVLVAGPGTPFDLIEALRDRKGQMTTQVILARAFDTSVTPLALTVEKHRLRPATSYPDVDTFLAEHARSLREAVQRIAEAKKAAAAPPPEPPRPAPAPDPWLSQAAGQRHDRDLLAEADRLFKAGVDPMDLVQEPARPGTAEDFARAVMSAFDRSALTAVMWHGLSVCLADVVQPGGLREQVLGLHGWLVRNGRLDEFVNEAVRRNPGDPTLAAYARGRRQGAHDALQASVNAPAAAAMSAHEVAMLAIQAGISRDRLLSGINVFYTASLHTRSSPLEQLIADIDNMRRTKELTDGTRPWSQWLQNAVSASQGRTENAAFRALLAQENAPAPTKGTDRNAVYDRLNRMLPSQLSAVAMKLGMPLAWLPGPTASTSDHAIAIIRWAEQGGQMQRLLDAEASAQRSYR